MFVRYIGPTTEKALCSPSFSQRSVATRVCPRRVAIAGHVIKLKCEIDQKREYIIVNGKATFSGLQTMW